MRCIQCGNVFHDGGIFVNADGDITCSDKCKMAYKAEKEDFLHRIVHSESLTVAYLLQ